MHPTSQNITLLEKDFESQLSSPLLEVVLDINPPQIFSSDSSSAPNHCNPYDLGKSLSLSSLLSHLDLPLHSPNKTFINFNLNHLPLQKTMSNLPTNNISYPNNMTPNTPPPSTNPTPTSPIFPFPLPPNISHPPPLSPNTQNAQNPVSLLIIPIRWPQATNMTTDNNPPPQDQREKILNTIFESYQQENSPTSGMTLIWINLLHGLLKNSPWIHYWASLLGFAYLNNIRNNHTRVVATQLRLRHTFVLPSPRFNNVLQYNWFPAPPPLPNSLLTNLHASPLLHSFTFPLSGINITLIGNQNHCASFIGPPHLVETYIDIDCGLNIDTGIVDYNLHLNPSFAFDPNNPSHDSETTTPPSSPPINPTF